MWLKRSILRLDRFRECSIVPGDLTHDLIESPIIPLLAYCFHLCNQFCQNIILLAVEAINDYLQETHASAIINNLNFRA